MYNASVKNATDEIACIIAAIIGFLKRPTATNFELNLAQLNVLMQFIYQPLLN